MLMRNFLLNARAHHMKKATLWVLEKNQIARSFYEAAGFQKTSLQMFRPGTEKLLLKYEKILC